MRKIWGEEFRTTTLCIDSYENSEPTGRFYNSCIPEGRSFRGLASFLLELEQLLDRIELPKSFTTPRSFAETIKTEPELPDTEFCPGKLATFALRILFRQNVSWQGSIVWIDARQEESFRSVLELIFLMDSALSRKKASET